MLLLGHCCQKVNRRERKPFDKATFCQNVALHFFKISYSDLRLAQTQCCAVNFQQSHSFWPPQALKRLHIKWTLAAESELTASEAACKSRFGLWWCLRVQGRTAMFHRAVKSVCKPNRGWEREEISSGISRKPFLDLSILFYPFIYSLPLSFSLNPFRLFSTPAPSAIFCYFHHSLPPPGANRFYFCSSVRHNYSNYANSRLSRRLQSNAKLHHKDFWLMS